MLFKVFLRFAYFKDIDKQSGVLKNDKILEISSLLVQKREINTNRCYMNEVYYEVML